MNATANRRAQSPTTPDALRRVIRDRHHTDHTVGLAPGYVQGNVVILETALAPDFLRFCQRNPKPCPLLAVSEPGARSLPSLGDLDIATDVPRYNVYREGVLMDSPTDVSNLWHDDLVSFVLGCSFSFEEALLEAGLTLRHVEANVNVPMYRTNMPTVPAGPFAGPLVVSMRPFTPTDAIRAIQVTSRFPAVHGAPVHFGDPAALGIEDLDEPDWGERVEVRPGEVPVFWACGVTPQAALARARPALCITHAPGHMLVTDLRNAQLAAL